MALLTANRRLLLGVAVLAAFLFFAFYASRFFTLAGPDDACRALEACPHQAQARFLQDLVPLLASLAVVVGAGSFYLMSGVLENKQASLKRHAEILQRFLDRDERRVFKYLVENNGTCLQSELSRLEGMTRLKSHRVLARLEARGVVERVRVGKTRRVRLAREIREALG